MNEEEPLITTELGLEVPPRPDEEWRKHTAERWKRDDRESYEMAVELLRNGMVNQSALARMVTEHRERRGMKEGISRNTIHALMMSDEFGPGEIEAIIEKGSKIATAQALDKMMEVVDLVTRPKDLGAVAMALTTANNVKQLASGKPTAIVERRDKLTVQDFERLREKARAKLVGRVIDVPGPLALPEVVTVPVPDAGGKEVLEVRKKGE